MDFSPHARAAAVVAGDLAIALGASIRYLTVLDVSDLRVALKARLHGFDTSAEVRAAVAQWVDDQYAKLSTPAGVETTRTIERGNAEPKIVAAIEKYQVDLVVMGSSGLARKLPIGSKTGEVLRLSPVPVLVCKKP
jgi:nucleotide-binding universal stress UspA family protein